MQTPILGNSGYGVEKGLTEAHLKMRKWAKMSQVVHIGTWEGQLSRQKSGVNFMFYWTGKWGTKG